MASILIDAILLGINHENYVNRRNKYWYSIYMVVLFFMVLMDLYFYEMIGKSGY